MMNKIVFLFVIAFVFVSCDSLKVVSDLDKTVDFTKYKTLTYHGWAENSDEIMNRFDKERLEKAFGDEFRNRGVEVVESNGDIIVSLYIVTEQRIEKTATTTSMGGSYGGYGRYGYGGYYGYGPGYGWGGGHSVTTINENEYTDGTLIVSVYDAEKKVLVWESIGKGTINENPDYRAKNIPRAVSKIMSRYPVKPAK